MRLIPTYIINLKLRPERREAVLKEFENKTEFAVALIDAIKHEIGTIGLWQTIKYILQNKTNETDDYILICEDDHEFTQNYSKEQLFSAISEAKERNADIICGGVSWFTNAFQVTDNIYWVEEFSGTQFMIVFRKFFQPVIDADFAEYDSADYKICELSTNLFFIFPFISIQKDYGYSDVTPKNNSNGRVADLFKQASEKVNAIKKITDYYKSIDTAGFESDAFNFDLITLPTYIINLPERTDRLEHIKRQFKGKKEFDVTIVEACRHQIGAAGLWQSIRKIVQMAIDNDDDVIIICEDDHEFTADYNKECLIRNIIEAGLQGRNTFQEEPAGLQGLYVFQKTGIGWPPAWLRNLLFFTKLFLTKF